MSISNVFWALMFVALVFAARAYQTNGLESGRQYKAEMECFKAASETNAKIQPCFELMEYHKSLK